MLFLSTNAFAIDLVCFTQKTQKTFGIKFDGTLQTALAVESANRTFSAPRSEAKWSNGKLSVKLDMGRSGGVTLSVKEVASPYPEYERRFIGKAEVRVFMANEINTDGVENISCTLPVRAR